MFAVLIQMFLLILCGAAWRFLRPGGLEGDQSRKVLTAVVYYLFLPALILKLMSRSQLGLESVKISLYGVAIVGFGAFLTAAFVHWRRLPSAQAGAVWLAVTFPNVTFLGLPVLLEVFGDWAALVVIQLDLFACTPLVLTLGIAVARAFGSTGHGNHFVALLRVPPVWAAAVAITLNFLGWRWPPWGIGFLTLLANGVTPLMLLSLGLALDWRVLSWQAWPLAGPVIFFKLVLMPVFGWWLALRLGFSGDKATALVLEAGMPSMLFGIVLCDRFGLDSRLYALLVTVTTLVSIVTLPLWSEFINAGGW